MNGEDMKQQGLQQMDVVDLISHFEGEQRVAKCFIIVTAIFQNNALLPTFQKPMF